ncbi:MAG: transcription-repair coupling factor [Lachnospiraceae bacterium]|nr:transcription-repair coupling factor [Lachnospiraceae bacterium]
MTRALEHIHASEPFLLSGAGDQVQNHLSAAFSSFTGKPVMIIAPTELRAREIAEEISFYDKEGTWFFPSKDPLFYSADARGIAIEDRRLRLFRTLLSEPEKVRILVLSIEAFFDRLIPGQVWKDAILRKRIGDEISMEDLRNSLVSMGYEFTEQIDGPGQFSVRGGIADIYPVGEDGAYRVEFWGDEIDSIRLIDPETQRSTVRQEYITLYPAQEIIASREEIHSAITRIRKDAEKGVDSLKKEGLGEEAERLQSITDHLLDKLSAGRRADLESYIGYFYEKTASILDYMPPETLLIYQEPVRIKEKMRTLQEELSSSVRDRLRKGYILSAQTGMFPTFEELEPVMSTYGRVFICSLLSSGQSAFPIKDIVTISSRSINVIQGSGEMLQDELRSNNQLGYRTILLTDSSLRAARTVSTLNMADIPAYEYQDMEKIPAEGRVAVARGSLGHGFSYPELKFTVMSLKELTEKGSSRKKNKKKFKGGMRIDNFSDIAAGDLVVHENHGVGMYQGIVRMQDGDSRRDYFKIGYREGGVLYVPTTSLDLLQKYIAVEGQEVRLNSLSGTDWERTKRKVREGVKKLAEDLIQLYARRMAAVGHAFSPDTVWQREFEDSFPFEETEDQLRAIEETKQDMESSHIMDRLICGDVGFGKTEVAIRAAFKAVQDSKQVAILAPTTILAQQHYNTFVTRMKEYPVNVGLLSRFVTPSQSASVIRELEDGTMDIVVGTHRLLSGNVRFKNLGLLVIDEEQRFGVGHKEKIKSLKKDVDVLTLSATPIPRTLHMSLNGMRDMSLLEDAPQDRHPVQTYVMEQDDQTVREAIYRELGRGGQVFYLHNRVENILETTEKLRLLVPESNVQCAHGQMSERELEQVMVRFVDGEIDVLICTTIIETGLDIPNANTLIVENADGMGLAQLYQLRGRVGRSTRLAYAYFLYRRGKVLSEVAQKRLEAIGELTDFGSGYKIALRDLEIRGAGNVLGPEQHGHMGAVGYDLYCKLLQEAVSALHGEAPPESFETTVKVTVDAYLPADYIRSEQQKLDMYKRIAAIRTDDDHDDLLDEMIDRFGDPPKCAVNLLKIALIKAFANETGCDSLEYVRALLVLRFREDAPFDLDKLTEYLMQRAGDIRLIPERGHQKMQIRMEHQAKDGVLLENILEEVRGLKELKAESEGEGENGSPAVKGAKV